MFNLKKNTHYPKVFDMDLGYVVSTADCTIECLGSAAEVVKYYHLWH